MVWPSGGGSVNPTRGARLWWGLECTGGSGPNPLVVGKVLSTDTVLSRIQTSDPGSVTPVFAFDQNQIGQQPKGPNLFPAGWSTTFPVYDHDICPKGSVILVNPTGIPGGVGALAGYVRKRLA